MQDARGNRQDAAISLITNIGATVTHRHLAANASRVATSLARLSSGLRINSAADDAAGLGISERMRAQIRGLTQAGRNIQDGISMLQTIDGALSEVHSILQRARELAVERNNGTLSVADKNAMKNEFIQLSNEVARIEQSVTFNGLPLLQNSSAVVTLQVGSNAGDTISLSLVDLFGGVPGCLVRGNTFFTASFMPADIAGFDQHIDSVSTARARFGAIVNRLEYTLDNVHQSQENLMAAESRVRDVDVAEEMTNLVKAQLLQHAATGMLAQAQHTPSMVLSLLDGVRAGP